MTAMVPNPHSDRHARQRDVIVQQGRLKASKIACKPLKHILIEVVVDILAVSRADSYTGSHRLAVMIIRLDH